MASAICPIADRSAFVIRKNMAKIKLLTVAGPLLCHAAQANRVIRLLENCRSWGIERPLVMLAVHNDNEEAAAEWFQAEVAHGLARCIIVRQKGHNETISNAIGLFRKQFDPTADPFTAKRQSLYLTRRGGKGKPNFVSPFLDGAGTTCGEWTRPMVRNPDGTVIKGFMKASVAVGFCPVECPYCYLNMPYTEGMDVALNWEDLADELQKKWQWYQYPINFGETSGLVEYDEWFAEPDGTGSMIQFVIDACAEAEVTPFFLTKIRYPRYLRVTVHVVEAKSPCRTRLQVVRSEPYGRSSPFAARDLGTDTANGPGDDSAARGGARPAAGRSGPVEGDGRSGGTEVGAHLAELFAAPVD